MMKYYRLCVLMIIALFCLVFSFVYASDSEITQYNSKSNIGNQIIVKESGLVTVIIEMPEHTSLVLSVPNDADVKSKGLLQTSDNEKIFLSSGNKEGVLIYNTNSYTAKENNSWSLKLDKLQAFSSISVIMPNGVFVKNTTQSYEISDEYMVFRNITDVNIQYMFNTDFELTESRSVFFYLTIFFLLWTVAFFLVKFFIFDKRKSQPSSKEYLLKTLPHNERNILKIVIANEGKMLRNKLEKKSKLAKSSLAVSLNNLEKKNIIELDKSFTVHKVILTEWFKKI